MLDEPFAGIDPLAIDDLKMLIQKLKKKGLGILISDHNVKATTDICQKIFVISSGNIIAHGTPEEILNNEMVKKFILEIHLKIKKVELTLKKTKKTLLLEFYKK